MSRRLSLGGCLSAVRAPRFLLPVLLIFGVVLVPARADQPVADQPLTAAQQQRLKERDHYSEESDALLGEGKLPEAIAAAEKMLAIEQEVLGNNHLDVAGSLERLADMHEQREEFWFIRGKRTYLEKV